VRGGAEVEVQSFLTPELYCRWVVSFMLRLIYPRYPSDGGMQKRKGGGGGGLCELCLSLRAAQ
jgi:hypothetical protein